VAAIEYQGAQVQVHLAQPAHADAADDDDNPDRGAWIAVLGDADFHARPFEPGQRVSLAWPDAQAHRLQG
jgi:putative spermidine/putrescine transport system ATP-binding protein